MRKVELETGKVSQSVGLEDRLFGEGVAIWGDRIIQLTWKSHVGIIFDKATFRELRRFRIAGEGWGLADDGRNLIMSDGTSTLRFLDPESMRVVRRLSVQSNGKRIRNLNELEYINGEIFANVLDEDYIVRISPDTGAILGWVNLRGLRPRNSGVLNGIAYDSNDDRLFVTGKNWPNLFEIELTTQGL